MPALKDTSLLPAEEDLLYEEEILRNPFNLKYWWRYLQAKRDAPPQKRRIIYERALKALPGSYKLWHAYLKERRDAVRGLPINHPSLESLNHTYERALVTMHKMPRIWTEYLQVLVGQKFITKARHTFDAALKSLPVTQHDRVWALYLKFLEQDGIPVETALRVYRRYLKLEPTHMEDFIEFLIGAQRWQEAAERLAEVLNDDAFYSIKGKTRHQLWLELCDLLTKHAKEVKGIKVDAIIRGGIRKFTDEVGRLWTSLADFYIRQGLFERARDVFEEGMGSVMTVRDFSIIFDSYAQFEESLLAARMETLSLGAGGEEEEEEDDVELRLARLELLMERRPELLSSVLLRQNPHNVHEWHKRAKLFEGKTERQVLTYTEAVKTVDPQQAVGKPHTLWVSFAKLYEKHGEGDLTDARVVFEKAVQVPYKAVDDLAAVWCEWAEMELRHHNFDAALALMKQATSEPPVAVRRAAAESGTELVQLKLYRSTRLWSFYVDLEESLGTLESTRAVYDRVLDLRIATPQMVINFALLLEEHKYYEESFKVFERGVAAFKYPHVKDIWTTYLTKFVARYGGRKLERARDLFEQALQSAPPEHAKALYLQYAKLEEEHGFARHAMAVYQRAAKAVTDTDRMSVYEVYIARAAEFFGVPKTRDIYEQAIESGLPDKDVKAMCLKYANLERKLQEIDRARAIFVHASQLADPRADEQFWEEWKQFEVAHGNEDTFREMLRINRSVMASYSQTHFIMPEYISGKASKGEDEPAAPPAAPPRGAPEAEAAPRAALNFVSSGTAREALAEALELVAQPGPAAENPEEIELGDDDKEVAEEEEEDGLDVVQKEVPASVFGDLADKVASLEERGTEEHVGALQRIKRQRR